MNRQPIVADRFYPGHPVTLARTLDGLIPDIPEEEKHSARAVIVPHAGYVYSGAVAGETFARVKIPETVLILGPNHHGAGGPLGLSTVDWDMPLGTVPLDRKLAELVLQHCQQVHADEAAHHSEHSLEVQVPFLQRLQKNIRIVPLVVSQLPYEVCVEVATGLAGAIAAFAKPVLLVASTDMTHYESRQRASRQDHLALERIQELDPKGLYTTVLENRISMCGIMPTTITLLVALELGAVTVELVRYIDSGETSGDTEQVVGYAGLVIR